MKELRPYVFHASTTSLCATCLARVPAKVVLEDGAAWLLKRCPEHGDERALLEDDAAWYLRRTAWDKPGTVHVPQTAIDRGCPHDCGLCPDHEQHTCIGLVEVTGACDASCPACFAAAPSGGHRPLETVRRMIGWLREAERGHGEVLQLSGGEPTCHPDIEAILATAMDAGFRCVMLNTNGGRIAGDERFADALARWAGGGFEVYLQCDGVTERPGAALRGRPRLDVQRRAIERLAARGVPVTLVATIAEGVNDDEIGRLVLFGLDTPGVRGINFQPLAALGRTIDGFDPCRRTTLSGVLRAIGEQTGGLLQRDDFIPLPCDTDRVAITYLLRQKGGFVPMLRGVDVTRFLPLIENTLAFDTGDVLRHVAERLRSGTPFCTCLSFLEHFRKIAPVTLHFASQAAQARWVTENTFRITVTSFLDRFNFEERAMKKECVHVVTPDLRRVPFSAWYLLHAGRSAAGPAC